MMQQLLLPLRKRQVKKTSNNLIRNSPMRKYLLHIGLASLCVCASVSVSAQEDTPVSLIPDARHGVATNSFRQNWEVSLGIQGLSFFSNQEYDLGLSQSPFKDFRTQLGLSAAVAKWFAPEIGLRTKLSGAWARKVSTADKAANAIKYMNIHEDVLLNLTNIFSSYDQSRKVNVIAYGGVGMARNFSDNENSITFDVGLEANYRIAEQMKMYLDLGMTFAGDEFDSDRYLNKKLLWNYDRWVTAEIGLTVELGQNKWKHLKDMVDGEILRVSRQELKETQQEVKKLQEDIEYLQSLPADTVTIAPEVSIFFEIGSAVLTQRGQLENIRAMAQKAIKEDRVIVVTGYADSQTGNPQLNRELSARRADTIVFELMALGVTADKIQVIVGGGVNTLDPQPANRRAVISLK